MSTTNFGALNTNQLTAWSRDLWKAARENSFIMKFAGKGPNAVIQRVTELTKSKKGTRAIISLVADLTGDGIMGDAQMEGNEEAINAYDQEITIDQIRNANRMAGRVADQKTIVNFRNTSKDVLAYWLADRVDQMAFLTASGVEYTENLNGTARPVLATGKNLADLDFAGAVTAPSTNRYLNWNGANGLVAGSTTADTIVTSSYEMLVRAKAYAKDHFIRGVKGPGNTEYYHVFMTPGGIADLKLDSDFKAAVNNAQVRGGSNPVWTGSLPTIDGLVIHEHRHVLNTQGATSGTDKWGASADINGQGVLFMGSQALALADIGMPYWSEDEFDYDNQFGISIGKMMGLLKPVFHSNVDGGDEDFGILRINTAVEVSSY